MAYTQRGEPIETMHLGWHERKTVRSPGSHTVVRLQRNPLFFSKWLETPHLNVQSMTEKKCGHLVTCTITFDLMQDHAASFRGALQHCDIIAQRWADEKQMPAYVSTICTDHAQKDLFVICMTRSQNQLYGCHLSIEGHTYTVDKTVPQHYLFDAIQAHRWARVTLRPQSLQARTLSSLAQPRRTCIIWDIQHIDVCHEL